MSAIEDGPEAQAHGLWRALGGKVTKDGFMLHCPAHDDRTPSLHVTTSDTRLLLHCFAGCEHSAVTDALRRRGLLPGGNRSPSGGVRPAPAPRSAPPVSSLYPAPSSALPSRLATQRRDEVEGEYVYLDEQKRMAHMTVRFKGKRFYQMHRVGKTVELGVDAAHTVLYRLPQLLAADPGTPVLLAEGEKDADRLAGEGFVATTAPLGASNWQPHYNRWLQGRPVVILHDNDPAGRKGAETKARTLQGVAASIRIHTFPDLPPGGDVSDYLDAGHTSEHLSRLIESLPLWRDPAVPYLRIEADMHRVQSKGIGWLWESYIPRGKLTILDGDPGVGKTTLALALISAITRGYPLPGDARNGREPERVLLLAGEDDLEDTIKPKLVTLDADCSRIRPVLGLIQNDEERSLTLTPDGIEALEREIATYRPSLLVIDPLVAYLGGGVDMYRANEVRALIDPLIRLARTHDLAVLALRHLTKAQGGRALYRGMGSVDFAAAARSILLLVKDPEDANRSILAPAKASLSALAPSIAFRWDGTRFSWEGPVEQDADDLLASVADTEYRGQRSEAKSFLAAMLEDGPLPAGRIKEQAAEAGIAERTLERAKRDLGVRARQEVQQGTRQWVWCAP